MTEKKLTISRNGVAIYTGPSIPPNMIQPGDTVHLGPGMWEPADAGFPHEVSVKITSHPLPVPTPEELVRRAGESLRRNNDFFAPLSSRAKPRKP